MFKNLILSSAIAVTLVTSGCNSEQSKFSQCVREGKQMRKDIYKECIRGSEGDEYAEEVE